MIQLKARLLGIETTSSLTPRSEDPAPAKVSMGALARFVVETVMGDIEIETPVGREFVDETRERFETRWVVRLEVER